MPYRYPTVAIVLVLLAACGGVGTEPPTPTPTATRPPASAPRQAATAGGATSPPATRPTAGGPASPAATRPPPPPPPALRRQGPPTPRAVGTATPALTQTVRGEMGRCQARLPEQFRQEGRAWRVGDEAAVTLSSAPTPGLGVVDVEAVSGPVVDRVRGEVGDFRETGRTRAGPDRLRIRFTGTLRDQPGRGLIYERQFDQAICVLVLAAAEGQWPHYEPLFERIIASLQPAP